MRLAAISLVVCMATTAAAQKQAGEIIQISGQGEHQTAGQPSWKAAQVNQAVFNEDYVRTLDKSRMALRLADGETKQLGPNTRLQVVKVAATADPKTILEMNKGRMWNDSTTQPPGGVEVRTPRKTVAAMRGTDWEIEVDDGENTTVSVFSGEVQLSNDQGSVLVGANEAAKAEPGKAPVKLLLRTSRARIQWVTSYTVDPARYADVDKETTALIRENRLGEAYERVRGAAASGAQAVSFLLLADFEIYSGDLAAARSALEKGAARFPDDARFDVTLSRLALLEDDVAGARTRVDTALRKRAEFPDALIMRGDIERHEGRAKEALEAYGRAVAAASKDPRGWYGLGAVAGEREDVGRARSDLTKAIELDQSQSTYRAELGTVEGFAGDFAAGREHLRKALELQPDNYVALTGLGVLELKTGNLEAAIAALQRASVIEPRYARAHVYLAAAYYHVGVEKEALFQLQRAQELDPNDPLPHLLKSIIHQDLIDPVEAVREAQEALKRIPFLKSLNQVADSQKGIANVGAPLASLGLESWARSAAHESYLPFWGGSHLFLADRYAGDFNKRSELMQGFTTDPIVFGASNRFHSLVVEPGYHATASVQYARDGHVKLVEPVVTLNGSDASQVPLSYFAEAIDTRLDPLDTDFKARAKTYTAALGVKLTHEVGAFIYANRLSVDADIGRAGVPGALQNIDGKTSRIDGGVRYAPNARTSVWLKGGATDEDSTLDETDTAIANSRTFIHQSHFVTKPKADDILLRATVLAAENLELTAGAESARLKTPKLLVSDPPNLFHTPDTTVPKQTLDELDHDRSTNVYAVARWGDAAFRIDAGATWSDYHKDRAFTITSTGGVTNLAEGYRRRRLDPFAGAAWRIAPGSLIRAACRRWARPISFDTLGPVAIAGVPLDDQLVLAGGTLDQCRGQFEWTDSDRTFATAYVERDRVKNLVSKLDGVQNQSADATNLDRLRNRVQTPPPKPDLLEDRPIFGEGTVRRANVALERILNPVLAAGLNYTYSNSENTGASLSGREIPYLARHQTSVVVTAAPGWRSFITVQAVYRSRRFTDEANTVTLRAGWDAQVSAFKESYDKRWAVEVHASNLLKKDESNLYGIVVSYRF